MDSSFCAQRSLGVALGAALLIAGAGVAGCGDSGDTGTAVRLQSDLGEHHHPISTDSALAQRYFDQGLNLAFGFNHELAVLSFVRPSTP